MVFIKYLLKNIPPFKCSKAKFVDFPLFTTDLELRNALDNTQKTAINELIFKIRNGEYRRLENKCFCGNENKNLDILVSKFDMHGIPLDILFCKNCGLIRSAEIFDQKSNDIYYTYDYRNIHSGENYSVEKYFYDQTERGKCFLNILNANNLLNKINVVAEIGCGSGGVLYPFFVEGKETFGFDYDEQYIQYGINKGMKLFRPDEVDEKTYISSADILILSHVMEHFLCPIQEMLNIIEILRDGSYLLVEVPGVFCENTRRILYGYPIRYFQISHVIQYFYYEYLCLFYSELGLEIIYGDETATFITRKPAGWEKRDIKNIYSNRLSSYPALIENILKETYFDYKYRPDMFKVKKYIIYFLEIIGIKNFIKKMLLKNH